jgi:hypothetical protein
MQGTYFYIIKEREREKVKFGKQSKRSKSNQKGQFVSKRSKIKRFLIAEKLFYFFLHMASNRKGRSVSTEGHFFCP